MLKFKLFYKISFINITSHLSSMLKIFDLLIIAAHQCKSIFPLEAEAQKNLSKPTQLTLVSYGVF